MTRIHVTDATTPARPAPNVDAVHAKWQLALIDFMEQRLHLHEVAPALAVELDRRLMMLLAGAPVDPDAPRALS